MGDVEACCRDPQGALGTERQPSGWGGSRAPKVLDTWGQGREDGVVGLLTLYCLLVPRWNGKNNRLLIIEKKGIAKCRIKRVLTRVDSLLSLSRF